MSRKCKPASLMFVLLSLSFVYSFLALQANGQETYLGDLIFDPVSCVVLYVFPR